MENIKTVTFYIDWKQRAQDRGKENKALRKRIKELVQSRDGWKEKALKSQLKYDQANNKLSSLEASFKKNFC
jgi:hypothetical protein